MNAMEVKNEVKTAAAKGLEDLRRAEAAGAHVMAARNALRKGERPRAKELIKEAFAANPGDISAVELLGDMLLEEGETEQALKLFERALKMHPAHIEFEEKLAICRIDLAEMESDKLVKHKVLEFGDQNKIFDRSSTKAMTLSMLLPGAGQFYNEENEKGTGYLVAGIVTFLAWFFPLMGALSKTKMDFMAALHTLSGFNSVLFYVGCTAYTGIYAASIVGAAASAKRYNQARRASLGL
jgi:tetratricopeptide (TPR) repeat protein